MRQLPFGQPIEALNRQYIILEGSLTYIITLAMPIELVEDHLQSFSEEVETFRFIK